MLRDSEPSSGAGATFSRGEKGYQLSIVANQIDALREMQERLTIG